MKAIFTLKSVLSSTRRDKVFRAIVKPLTIITRLLCRLKLHKNLINLKITIFRIGGKSKLRFKTRKTGSEKAASNQLVVATVFSELGFRISNFSLLFPIILKNHDFQMYKDFLKRIARRHKHGHRHTSTNNNLSSIGACAIFVCSCCVCKSRFHLSVQAPVEVRPILHILGPLQNHSKLALAIASVAACLFG